MDNVDYAKSVNSYLTDYIKFADVKAGAVVTLALAIAGALAGLVQHVIDFRVHQTPSTNIGDMTVAAVILTGVASAAAIVAAVSALLPRLRQSSDSLNSFPNIVAFKNEDSYAGAVRELDGDGVRDHLSRHNFTLAVIAQKKFVCLQIAIFALGLAIVCLILVACSYGLLRVA